MTIARKTNVSSLKVVPRPQDTHTPGKSVVSVKGGCIEGLDWKMAKHIWVKRAMVPIPEGAEVLEEEPDYDPYICRTTDLLENRKMDAGAA
ncbi:hypothetical protein BPAE_0004g01630 [Botrytis paeoniae]|uniref:Uncharacterized protein n=1 Tax=Botrytis paeoniae TaxID=278948 RepID=A0A4Z1G994_9HELO|nr:hypothetical protein BPAE_0004g01630 [Botrytis paeoniae]